MQAEHNTMINYSHAGSRLIIGTLTAIVAGLTLTGNAIAAPEQVFNSRAGLYKPNEVLVKYQPTMATAQRSVALSSVNAIASKAVGRSGYHLVKLQNTSTEQAISTLRLQTGVASVQPNFIYHTTAIPNDTSFGQLWGLQNNAQTVSNASYNINNPGTAGMDMDAALAWNQITDCSSVTVAVIDTGIHYNHEDLTANMWDGGASYPNHGYDYIDNDNDPMDTHGHGTHVAGTIGAIGNNNTGTTGVCWQASIMAIRVLDTSGLGDTAGIIQGVDFARNNGARVINMSLGGSESDPAFNNAIGNAATAGVAVIVAAGNDGTNNDAIPAYPCNYTQPNLLCVAALDQAYSLADFSNTGATNVDVGAPGTNIMSAWNSPTYASDFSAWINSGAWTSIPAASSCIGLGILANPTNWCTGGSYTLNANDSSYQQYNLSGNEDFVAISYYANFNMNNTAPADGFGALYSISGNPIPGGTVLGGNYWTGSTGGWAGYSYELPACVGQTSCSIGFHLFESGGANVGPGAAITLAVFSAIDYAISTNYNTIDGTSMATPHVAGLATMLFAYNPNYNYSDVLNAIKAGGEDTASLSATTATGKAVNAMGALAYIHTPENVTATIP